MSLLACLNRFTRNHWPILFFAACLGFSVGLVTASSHAAFVPLRSDGGVPLTVIAKASKISPESRAKDTQWLTRHEAIKRHARTRNPNLVFLGDSITQGWEFHHTEFAKFFGAYRTMNAGISSDRVEHILWRVKSGTFDEIHPDVVVLLAGINNLAVNTPEEIAAGHVRIIQEIHKRSPRTQILLLGVFPSGANAHHKRRPRIAKLNATLAKLGDMPGVTYRDIGNVFLSSDGSISKDIMFDHLHLTAKAYERWGRSMRQDIDRLMRAPHI